MVPLLSGRRDPAVSVQRQSTRNLPTIGAAGGAWRAPNRSPALHRRAPSLPSMRFRDRDFGRLAWMTMWLFLSYLTVAMALPVVPVYVAHDLGLGNVFGGLAVGIAFVSTILTRN
jgi:hypothetical protein